MQNLQGEFDPPRGITNWSVKEIAIPFETPVHLIDEGVWDGGGYLQPWRMLVRLEFEDPQDPLITASLLAQTPFAIWCSATHAFDDGRYESKVEIVPARKVWPSFEYWSIALEYRGDTIEPTRYEATDGWDLNIRSRLLFVSSNWPSIAPAVKLQQMIQWNDQL